jgi:hypothetical protein
MKEHKIEILCQMEDERDSPVEHCNAGPGFNVGQANIQSGLGGGLSGLGDLLKALDSGLLGQHRTKCFHCGK